ncbi:hypothetical protein AVEN_35266-1 [Araneus ventricosus]|uniref:Uncharacterized protein n=1 Tax=Araneus ventricosus TaxID=182803 RepID=A0A4Y2EH67_ARAVE|nr:hypothetical protein AVEN_35266-1 [Araneus ventricosus]
MLQHGKKKFQLQLKKKSYQRMLRSKIIDSKPRSPSSYTSRRDNCDAEVIGIITLKAHESSFQFISRKTCFEHQAAACKKQDSKKKGTSTRLHSSALSHNSPTKKKKKRHVCCTLLPFMLFFAKTCSKASPPRTLVCSLSVQL